MIACIPVLVLAGTVVAVEMYILLPEAELEEEVVDVADDGVASLRRRHPLIDQVVDLLWNPLWSGLKRVAGVVDLLSEVDWSGLKRVARVVDLLSEVHWSGL